MIAKCIKATLYPEAFTKEPTKVVKTLRKKSALTLIF